MEYHFLRNNYPRSVENDVVLIGIDDETRTRFREPVSLWHKYFGKLLESMAIAKPDTVGLDIIFPDRSYDFLDHSYENFLRKGIIAARKSTRVIYGITVNTDGSFRHISKRLLISAGGEKNTGVVLWNRDSDRIVRKFSDITADNGSKVITLVGRMARLTGTAPASGYIDFSIGKRFEYIPLHNVLSWLENNQHEKLKQTFKGKSVIVGTVLPFEDRHYMPVNLTAWEEDNQNFQPGMLLHAQALRSIKNSGLIRPVAPAWILVLALIASSIWFTSKRIISGSMVFLGISVFIVCMATYLLYHGWYVPIASLTSAAMIGFLGRVATESTRHIMEKYRLRNAFGGYISPQIMDEILDGNLEPGLGGQSRNICVLFSDVRGFTQRSEKSSPEEIVWLLNRYFEKMATAIHDNGGTIDKFMGDGIMAFFNAPNTLERPCQKAFQASKDMLIKLEELNSELKNEGIPAVNIGIGLHTGDAIVGHLGSRERHEYTAIGDVVNVTARLESLTKEAGYPLLCSREVLDEIPEHETEFDPLGEKPIKGHTPVPVYGWPASDTRD